MQNLNHIRLCDPAVLIKLNQAISGSQAFLQSLDKFPITLWVSHPTVSVLIKLFKQ